MAERLNMTGSHSLSSSLYHGLWLCFRLMKYAPQTEGCLTSGALNSPYLTQIVEYSEEKCLEKSPWARFPGKIPSVSSARGVRMRNNPRLYYLLAWPGAKTCVMKPNRAGREQKTAFVGITIKTGRSLAVKLRRHV